MDLCDGGMPTALGDNVLSPTDVENDAWCDSIIEEFEAECALEKRRHWHATHFLKGQSVAVAVAEDRRAIVQSKSAELTRLLDCGRDRSGRRRLPILVAPGCRMRGVVVGCMRGVLAGCVVWL